MKKSPCLPGTQEPTIFLMDGIGENPPSFPWENELGMVILKRCHFNERGYIHV